MTGDASGRLAHTAAEDAWPRARSPLAAAAMRSVPEDFQVSERLSFEPGGEGEFALLRVRKVGRNTAEVARELARAAGVPARGVSWAGRKDRRALAEQWFSVHLAGRAGPDWRAVAGAGWAVCEAHRHPRKLRLGALSENAFAIVLRGCSVDPAALDARLAALADEGVPNYFGPQRFGRGGGNLIAAAQPDRRLRRHERALALSAARSALFNAVLARRVEDASWNRLVDGEVPMLRGSRAVFGPEPLTDELRGRARSGEIDPTGPLWGTGPLRTAGALALLEGSEASALAPLARRLESAGLAQERRRLRLVPRGLTGGLCEPGVVRLRFSLEAGAFATSVLREICATRPT